MGSEVDVQSMHCRCDASGSSNFDPASAGHFWGHLYYSFAGPSV